MGLHGKIKGQVLYLMFQEYIVVFRSLLWFTSQLCGSTLD